MISLRAFTVFGENQKQFHRKSVPEYNRRNPELQIFYLFPAFKRKAQG